MAKKGRKRAAVAAAESPVKATAAHDDGRREQSLNHSEVERRTAAIQATRVAELDSLCSQLRLFRSYFNKEKLETPALKFFEENSPNLSVIENEKDTIFELKWRDTAMHDDGRNARDSLDNVAGSHAVSAFDMSVESVRTRFFQSVDLHIPDFFPGELSENHTLGMNDVFQTPGSTGSRLSFGMTPKTSRLPKNGEMLLSVRGSPLGMYKEENLEAIRESEDGSHEGTS